MIKEEYLNKKLRQEKAKRDRNCHLCSSSWLAGEDIFIMSDPLTDKYELICKLCGDRILKEKEKRANVENVPVKEQIYLLLSELQRLIETL